jgi:hypothetical protein
MLREGHFARRHLPERHFPADKFAPKHLLGGHLQKTSGKIYLHTNVLRKIIYRKLSNGKCLPGKYPSDKYLP